MKDFKKLFNKKVTNKLSHDFFPYFGSHIKYSLVRKPFQILKKTSKVFVDISMHRTYYKYKDFLYRPAQWCIDNCESSCWMEYEYQKNGYDERQPQYVVFCFKDNTEAMLFKLTAL